MPSKQLRNWHAWGLSEAPEIVRFFSEGKNHQTALIKSAGQHYVLKTFQGATEPSVKAQQWAAKLGLSPNVLYANNDIVVMPFVQTSPSTTNKIPLLAQSLSTLHNAPTPSWRRFDLLKSCDQYLTSADPKIHQWHEQLLPSLHVFTQDNTPWCACHNDLVAQNFLFIGDRIQIIDWEYAMLNNPWFDLASVAIYQQLDQNQTKQLLLSYNKSFTKRANETIFHAAQLSVLWCDLLWHIERYGNSYIKHPDNRLDQLTGVAKKLLIEIN